MDKKDEKSLYPVNPRSFRKVRVGTVKSNKMQKTLVVKCEVAGVYHKKVHKEISAYILAYVHYSGESLIPVGTKVTIVESKPFSKKKRWALQSVCSDSYACTNGSMK